MESNDICELKSFILKLKTIRDELETTQIKLEKFKTDSTVSHMELDRLGLNGKGSPESAWLSDVMSTVNYSMNESSDNVSKVIMSLEKITRRGVREKSS